jgi:hypothetical protein
MMREAILALLTERSMHGYEMIREVERRSHGVWRPNPGSVYPALHALERAGLIAGEEIGGGRRQYRLTNAGRAAAAPGAPGAAGAAVAPGAAGIPVAPGAAGAPGAPPWAGLGGAYGGWLADARPAVQRVLAVAGEILRNGSDPQCRQVVTVLRQTRHELYRILATDPEKDHGDRGC